VFAGSTTNSLPTRFHPLHSLLNCSLMDTLQLMLARDGVAMLIVSLGGPFTAPGLYAAQQYAACTVSANDMGDCTEERFKTEKSKVTPPQALVTHKSPEAHSAAAAHSVPVESLLARNARHHAEWTGSSFYWLSNETAPALARTMRCASSERCSTCCRGCSGGKACAAEISAH
jgi:hypothetical protein